MSSAVPTHSVNPIVMVGEEGEEYTEVKGSDPFVVTRLIEAVGLIAKHYREVKR